MKNFENIDWETLEVSGVTTETRPFIIALSFTDGTPLTEEELEPLHDMLFEDQARRVEEIITNDDAPTSFTMELDDSDMEFTFELDLDGEDGDVD